MAAENTAGSPAREPGDRRPVRKDLGKVTRQYVAALGWRSVNRHTHISLVNRYVYIEVPKAGCGTMKATLGGVEAARLNQQAVAAVQERPHDATRMTAFIKPFQLPPDLLEEVFTSRRYRRFTVVREPASRLLSAYLEKIRQGLPQAAPVLDVLRQTLGDEAPNDAAQITLAQFIDVVGAQSSRQQDPHWRRQYDQLGLPYLNYDAIIHLEDLDDSWSTIAALSSIPDLREQFYCRNSTGAGARMDEHYTPQLREAVARIYADDYRAFNYRLPR
ncbi:MAG: sulfotransferase family protein [Actinomycetales bacterium]